MINSKNNIYNTPVEIAIRLLMIIVEYKSKIDFDKLVILDYLALHANIVDNSFESIHPDNPFHGLEVYSKINIAKQGLNLLISKGLIDIEFTAEGIQYNYNAISEHFLSFFDGEYYKKLKVSINNMIKEFYLYNSSDLQKYLYDNVSNWSGENFNIANTIKEEVDENGKD